MSFLRKGLAGEFIAHIHPTVSANVASQSKRCVALLGRPDRPTDAVEDYCQYLSQALEKHGCSLELLRVSWTEQGWSPALGEVRKKAEQERG